MRFASDKILHGRVQFLAFFSSEFMIYGKIFFMFLKRGSWISHFEACFFVLLSGFYDFFTSSLRGYVHFASLN